MLMYCCVQARAVEAAQGGCAADKVWVSGQHIAGPVCLPGHRGQPDQLGGRPPAPREVCMLCRTHQ